MWAQILSKCKLQKLKSLNLMLIIQATIIKQIINLIIKAINLKEGEILINKKVEWDKLLHKAESLKWILVNSFQIHLH